MQVHHIPPSSYERYERDLHVVRISSPSLPWPLHPIPVGLQDAYGARDLRPRYEDVEVTGHPQRVIAIECGRQGHPFERDHRDACRHQLLQHPTQFSGQEQIAPTVQERQVLELSRDRGRNLRIAKLLEMMRDEGHDSMDTGLVQKRGPIR
jgi:hypothetical protein